MDGCGSMANKKLNINWMEEISAGCMSSSPEISYILYEEVKETSVSESLHCVFRGDYLRKWRRSQPLTKSSKDKSQKGVNHVTDADDSTNKRFYSSQSRGRSHERFFWVSRICNTWFLRWYSKRKRSSESIFPLCKLNIMCKGNEITYYDDKGASDGFDKQLIFVLSGEKSLQLATSSHRDTLLWISGLFHIAKYARNEYTLNWITNSDILDPFFDTYKQTNIPKFDSKEVCKELNRKHNHLHHISDVMLEQSKDGFVFPDNLYSLIEFFHDMNLLGSLDSVEPIRSVVKRLMELRETTITKLKEFIGHNKIEPKPLDMLAKQCVNFLASVDIDASYYKSELRMYDPWLSYSECKTIFNNIVRQYALSVLLNENSNAILDPLMASEYERFITNVQAGNRMECSNTMLDIYNLSPVHPITIVFQEESRYRNSCLSKYIIPRIPIRILTVAGFQWSLSQSFNSICIPQDSDEIVNMLKYPIGSFWISSSHNTYLIGDQLGGSATAGALAEALLRGCRCIELDCQDGTNNEPILCHSWKNCQLSGSVTLREALTAIKETAFINSKLPVILSFEMHCSAEYTGIVANMIEEVLGEYLFTLTSEDEIDLIAKVPLGSLLGKILIKGKYKSSENSIISKGEGHWQSILSLRGFPIEDVTVDTLNKCKLNNVYAISETKFLKLSKSSLLPSLSDTCFVRVYPSGTRLASTNFCPIKPWSFGIQMVALNYQSFDRSMLLNYGKFHNSFGYVLKPPELRINTSKEDEILDYFYHGSVLVKIHVLSASQLPAIASFKQQNYVNSLSNIIVSIKRGYKNIDLISDLFPKSNDGKSTRKSIRKQEKDLTAAINDGLIIDEEDNSSTLNEIFDKSAKIILKHTDALCPFVEVTVVGDSEKTYKTETVNFNGFNPIWSDISPPFEFKVSDPNQAIIIFQVKHCEHLSTQLIGQAAFPINRIRPGIRWVQLLDQKLMEIDCCGLLLHIEMNHI